MRWNLWLAQPKSERSLKATLQIAAVIVTFWTLLAAYGVWSSRASLAVAQKLVSSQSDQTTQIARALPEKRCQALKAADVEVIASQGSSAEITGEFADLARVSGAEIQSVQIGDDKQASAAAQAAPASAVTAAAGGAADNPPSATSSTTAQAAAGSSDGSRETFECSIAGQYPALTRFLRELAASRHILDITSLQVMQNSGKAGPDALRLEMKLNGIVYEASGKS